MIQRIQSIFLLLAAIVMALLLFGPMYFVSVDKAVTNAAPMETMLADGVFETNDHIILLILVVVSMILPLVILFLFKNRVLQMKLGRINVTLIVLTLALSVILFLNDYRQISEGTEITIEFGYLAPVIAIILLALAIRFIKKDEKLVRSADRLR